MNNSPKYPLSGIIFGPEYFFKSVSKCFGSRSFSSYGILNFCYSPLAFSSDAYTLLLSSFIHMFPLEQSTPLSFML